MFALTPAQRQLVTDNLGLVRLQLRRSAPRTPASCADCEHDDLFQEGVLGLIRAAQRFDPERNGAFSAFALAHIDGAIRLARAERFSTIRVPARIRRRAATAESPANPPLRPTPATPRAGRTAARNARHSAAVPSSPDSPLHVTALPRVIRLGRLTHLCQSAAAKPDPRDRLLLAALRERGRAALLAAADSLAPPDHTRPDVRQLVATVLRRRLISRDRARRVSLRAAARRLRCAPARVHQCEQRLIRLAAQHLSRDPVAARLVALRFARPDGERLTPRRLRRRLRRTDRAAFDEHVARLDRAELQRLLGHLADRFHGRGERLARDLFNSLDRRDRARVLMRLAAPRAPQRRRRGAGAAPERSSSSTTD